MKNKWKIIFHFSFFIFSFSFFTFHFLLHRVISEPAPGVAPGNAFQPQPGAFEHAPFLYASYHVMRAGRVIPAGIGQERGNSALVNPYQEDQKCAQCLIQKIHL